MGKIKANRAVPSFISIIVFSQIFLALLSGIITKLLVDPLFEEKPYSGIWNIYIIVICLITYLCLTIYLYWLITQKANRIFGVRVKTMLARRQPGLKYLLMGYSPIRISLHELISELDAISAEKVASSAKDYVNPFKDADGKPVFNSWQQNLRAAWHHHKAGTLKAIYILNPDVDQFEGLKSYLQHALSKDLEIYRISRSEISAESFSIDDAGSGEESKPSYENYLYVYQGLERGLEMIRERGEVVSLSWISKILGKTQDEELDAVTCIDATPGQKSYSIAASVLTLNRRLKFSYVTNGGELRFYDTNLDFLGSGQ